MRIAISAFALGLVFSAGPAGAQRLVLLPFESVTLSSQQVLMGETRGEPVTLTGELRLPSQRPDRVPAVVLIHGIAGIGANADEWARALNEWGFAAFIVDSLTGRGITANTPEDYRLSSLARAVDAYRALAKLAQHPRVAPDRIALLGFSAGGTAVVFSAMERFQASVAPQGLHFAAIVGLYPSCVTRYRDDTKLVARPLRLFHGTADDWNPVEPCRTLVADMRKAGGDVTLTELPGATHSYDEPWTQRITFAQGVTLRKCSLKEGEGGQILNATTGQAFSFTDPCIERGVTLQHDEAATKATREAVRAILASAFAAKPPATTPAPAAGNAATGK